MKTKIFASFLLLIIVIGGYQYAMVKGWGLTGFNPDYLSKSVIVISSIIFIYMLTKIIDLLFTKSYQKLIRGDNIGKKIAPLIHNILLIFIWGVGILTTLDLIGFDLKTILTGAGIGGVLLALAGKEAASNLFGSLSLVFSKSFKIGDLIRVKGIEGNVEEITLSYTRILDKKGNFVYLPNKNLITETIENLSQGKQKKTEIQLPLPLDLGSKKIESLLEDLRHYGEKRVKGAELKEFQVAFESASSNSQSFTFSYLANPDADNVGLKKEVFLDLRKLLEKNEISLSRTS